MTSVSQGNEPERLHIPKELDTGMIDEYEYHHERFKDSNV